MAFWCLHSLHNLLYILYFSTEGHYGIMKDCYCVFLVCRSFGVHVLRFRDTRMYRCFQSVYFEITTRVLGNNLNVFIVFY